MPSALLIALLALVLPLPAQNQKKKTQWPKNLPQPRVVSPGDPPSDAIVLFGGASVDGFTKPDGSPTGCRAGNGEMLCATGSRDAVSKVKFGAVQLHLEFNIPLMLDKKGQLRGNSGVYLHGRFEVQILDGWDNPTYAMGVVGALYGTAPPLVNASRRPNEWQTYDIVCRAPKCFEDHLVKPGSVTVLLNGVLVQDHVSLIHRADACSSGRIPEKGPLMLQDHSGFPNAPHTEMRFRNIWLRPLDANDVVR
jgi:hypothetical protein